MNKKKITDLCPPIHLPTLKIEPKPQPGVYTLSEMDLTTKNLAKILKRAQGMKTGVIPNYIPALEYGIAGEPTDTAICISDTGGNIETVGTAQDTIVSAQSTIKVCLYLFALYKGANPEDIALGEAVAKNFAEDPITESSSDVKTAYHPLNNAGGISGASEINDWEEFMDFMRRLTGNSNLSVLEDTYQSESKCWQKNLRTSAALAAKGRFSLDQVIPALEKYTKACSIGLSVKDLTQIGLVIARGGICENESQLFNQGIAVRAMNAMNSFGFYEETGRMTLLQSGSRALTAKSGVSGLVLHVNPGIGAFSTLGRHVDRAGNSIFGMTAAIPLNQMFCTPGAMRLEEDDTARMLGTYIHDVKKFTVLEALARKAKGTFNPESFLLDNKYITAHQKTLQEEIAVCMQLKRQ